jgi:DNA-binding XRE family transcriptional regulator
MSRKPHEPTPTSRQLVQLHATIGTTQETIASILGIDPKTLRLYYREELDHALAQANATIGGALFNKARNGDTAAQIFWMKTRAGWREKQDIDLTSSDGTMSPPNTVTLKIIDTAGDE